MLNNFCKQTACALCLQELFNKAISNYLKQVAQKIEVEKGFLFGFYARGEADEHSDVDLNSSLASINIILKFIWGKLWKKL